MKLDWKSCSCRIMSTPERYGVNAHPILCKCKPGEMSSKSSSSGIFLVGDVFDFVVVIQSQTIVKNSAISWRFTTHSSPRCHASLFGGGAMLHPALVEAGFLMRATGILISGLGTSGRESKVERVVYSEVEGKLTCTLEVRFMKHLQQGRILYSV